MSHLESRTTASTTENVQFLLCMYLLRGLRGWLVLRMDYVHCLPVYMHVLTRRSMMVIPSPAAGPWHWQALVSFALRSVWPTLDSSDYPRCSHHQGFSSRLSIHRMDDKLFFLFGPSLTLHLGSASVSSLRHSILSALANSLPRKVHPVSRRFSRWRRQLKARRAEITIVPTLATTP